MPKVKSSESKSKGNDDSGLNFEAQLWAAAEQAVPAPHCGMTEYNGARPEGLFLKYISDAFEEKREQLLFGFNESAAKSKDVLGRVYEYFLGKFASAEGKGGGEFYTPQCVVQVLVAMLEPYKGRVFETLQSASIKQSQTLAALLPKLLSGQLRVPCSKEVLNG